MRGLVASLILMMAVGTVPAIAARQPESVKVQVSKEKLTPKSKVSIRFVELVEDSRCPTDVNCVWAGNGKIKVRISKNGRTHDVTMDTNGPNSVTVAEGYSIRLTGLTPSPRSNIRINRNGYVAVFEIVKLQR